MSSETSRSKDAQSEDQSAAAWKSDFLASIVVFLVALPLCMGIAIASGVPVSAGLVTGIVAGLVVGWLGGCQLQVSGPAAGLTVIVYEAVVHHGLEMLGLIVLIAGIVQMIAGALKLGQWFRAVSPAVVNGMLAGIGVLIFASQFHVMLDDVPQGSGIKNLATIPQAIQKAWRSPHLLEKKQRQAQRKALIQLGEFHRQQEVIHEKLAERLPDHVARESNDVEIDVDDLIKRQESLITATDQFIDDSLSFFDAQPKRQQRLLAAEERAIKEMNESLELLKSDDPFAALHHEEDASSAILAIEGVYKNHEIAAIVGVLTIISLLLWTSLARGRLKTVPAPLIAVIVGTTVATVWQLPLLYVEIPDSITEELHIVTPAILADAPWQALFTSGLVIAIVASAETLLSASAVDQMQSGPRTKYNKELFAQGVGNMCCGFLGALPMTGVIVRSGANVQAGAKTRLSAILHGIWLLIFVVFLGTFLRMIPTSALAAILVYTGYRLCDWRKVKVLSQYGWGEVAIYFVTVIVIVTEDLLMGVGVGLALAFAKLTFSVGKVQVDIREKPDGTTLLHLGGAATFLRIPQIATQLENIPAGATVDLDISNLIFIDHACFTLLSSWHDQHIASGGTIDADWDKLKAFAANGVQTAE